MGMVVRTNTMSANAYRQLGMNNTAVSKSLEKLSSGFRINRAGDDASGLAISEKMKAQISGLEQASANSQDGISLVQTAEGALTEVHSMLNRMTELATKSANGTIQNDVDRDSIQTEVDALNSEITRISKSTNFNGINLLDGSMAEGVNVSKATINSADTTATAIASTASSSKTAAFATTGVTTGAATYTVTVTAADGAKKDVSVDFTAAANGNESAVATALAADSTINSLFDVKADTTAHTITFTSKVQGSAASTITKTATTATGESGSGAITPTAGLDAGASLAVTTNLAAGDSITVNGKTFSFVANGGDTATAPQGTIGVEIGTNLAGSAANLQKAMETEGMTSMKVDGATANTLKITSSTNGGALELQVGTTNDSYNKVTVSVGDMSATGLGTAGLDVSSQASAGKAIDTIKTAINTVSTNRGNLGALQNRLEHAINNLDTTAENMTSANSRIRDTDMAKEMMNYTKMNILTQAAQAMLAQANQNPQSILQLLQ